MRKWKQGQREGSVGEGLAAKSDHLNSVPRTYVEEERSDSIQLSSDLSIRTMRCTVLAHTLNKYLYKKKEN